MVERQPFLWAPIAVKEEPLLHVFEAVKALASMIGAESLLTLCFKRDIELLGKAGLSPKEGKEPYMKKKLKEA